MFIIGGKDILYVYVYCINWYMCVDILLCKLNFLLWMLLDYIISLYSVCVFVCVICFMLIMGLLWLVCCCFVFMDDIVMYIINYIYLVSYLKFNLLLGF